MEIFVLETIRMKRSNIMQTRIEQLEKKLNQLRSICTELYKLHSYDLEDLNSESKPKYISLKLKKTHGMRKRIH